MFLCAFGCLGNIFGERISVTVQDLFREGNADLFEVDALLSWPQLNALQVVFQLS